MNAERVAKRPGMAEPDRALFMDRSAKVLVGTDWTRVLFLHYAVPSDVLRPWVSRRFEIEEHDGSAWVTLVALTMSGFWTHPQGPWWSGAFGWIAEQRFFNVRTYVRHGDALGAYFLWGWLSRPWGLPWTTAGLGLPGAFGGIEFDHPLAVGRIHGMVRTRSGQFSYAGVVDARQTFAPCPAGSLGQFALERYTGYFHYRGVDRQFETHHVPWTAVQIPLEAKDRSLVGGIFPWFGQARLVAAHFSPGVTGVWLSQPRAMERQAPDPILGEGKQAS